MPDVRLIGAILKRVHATIDRQRKEELAVALRQAADMLEKDERSFAEATAEVFGQIINDLAEKHNVGLGKQLEETAVESTRDLVRHARRQQRDK